VVAGAADRQHVRFAEFGSTGKEEEPQAMKRLLCALGLVFLLAEFTPMPAAGESFTGDWVGTINGVTVLRMHLVEGPQEVVVGWVVMGSISAADSLEVLLGYHAGPDTLHIYMSSCGEPSPQGCDQALDGVLDAPDHVAGVYYVRWGRQPPEYYSWEATRKFVAVRPETWGRIKQQYMQGAEEPNGPLQPPPAPGE
jgi:hypothetical protein